MSSSYRLIVSDVDGCLSPEESEAWDIDAFSSLVTYVRSHELPLTLCTGRPQPYVEVLMKLIDVRLPAIGENGALLYSLHDNRTHFAPAVTPAGLSAVARLVAFTRETLLPRYPDAVHQAGKEAQLSIFHPDPAVLPLIRREIEQFLEVTQNPAEPAFLLSASHYYLNVSLTGVNKGTALAKLIREMPGGPPPRSQIAAIGDTSGDLPMRAHVGFFAAPSNATDEVKAAADYVSDKRDIHGLLDILRRLT